jgi:hypothetical protein
MHQTKEKDLDRIGEHLFEGIGIDADLPDEGKINFGQGMQ